VVLPTEADRTAKVPGVLSLAGSLTWSDEALGWEAGWRFASGRATASWSVAGISFDAAFRNGLRGAAQIMSGNGKPE